MITGIRRVKKSKNIPNHEAIELYAILNEEVPNNLNSIILKLENVTNYIITDTPLEEALSFRVKSNEYFIPFEEKIDAEAEIKKIEEELKYTKGFLISVSKKLSNERFVNNAPEKVVAIEKQKQADAEAKIEALEKRLKSLS